MGTDTETMDNLSSFWTSMFPGMTPGTYTPGPQAPAPLTQPVQNGSTGIAGLPTSTQGMIPNAVNAMAGSNVVPTLNAGGSGGGGVGNAIASMGNQAATADNKTAGQDQQMSQQAAAQAVQQAQQIHPMMVRPSLIGLLGNGSGM